MRTYYLIQRQTQAGWRGNQKFETLEQAEAERKRYEAWLHRQADDVQRTVTATRITEIISKPLRDTEQEFIPQIRGNDGDLEVM